MRETRCKRVASVGLVAVLVARGAFVLLDHGCAPPPPEGTIAYSGRDFGDVLVARVDGSGVRRLASDGSDPKRLSSAPAKFPSWSPDGSRIAFSLVTAGAVQIGIVRSDGRGERALTAPTENSELPAWSPDGSLIAFSRGFEGRRAIWTMKPDGTEAHAITEPGSDDVAPA